MKISVDDIQLFSLSGTQKKVIMHDINEDDFHNDMCRRLQWVLMNKYDQCFDRLKKDWDTKLAEKFSSIPTDKDEYAELVFSQGEYKSRKARENEG